MYNVGGPCGLATGAAAPCDGVMTDINGWMTMAALPMTSMVSSRDVIKFQIQIYTQMVATVRVAAEHGLLNRIRQLAPIYRVAKKFGGFLYSVTLSNINRFSKLFHCQNQEKICNNTSQKIPSHLKCVATLLCEMLLNGANCRSFSVITYGIGQWRRRLECVIQQQCGHIDNVDTSAAVNSIRFPARTLDRNCDHSRALGPLRCC